MSSSHYYYRMAPPRLDLTPFGFTPTESHAYATLLRLGPATGYAVAHAARLARANTYGALEGLVSRGAAARLAGRPARYRAADPPALLAQLAALQGASLERLSRALKDVSRPAEPETRSIEGTRAVANLILQLVEDFGIIAMEGEKADCIVELGAGTGPITAELLRPTLPAWRRAAARAELVLRVSGDVPAEAGPVVAGSVGPDAPIVLLIDEAHIISVAGAGDTAAGIWSSHPAVAALARAALRSIT